MSRAAVPTPSLAPPDHCSPLLPTLHTAVVRYFGTVLSKPNYALVMEYCAVQLPGGHWATSLHDLLAEKSVALPWRERLLLASGIAAGMQHLHHLRVGPHKRAIVHGDLKASNVLLTVGGPFDEARFTPRISDFGLSRLSQGSLSRSNSGGGARSSTAGRRNAGAPRLAPPVWIRSDVVLVVLRLLCCLSHLLRAAGTLAWIAPELLPPSIRRNTPESDVYSFAILLWEMATRAAPFAGRDTRLLAAQVRDGARPELPFGLAEELESEPHGRTLLNTMRRCWVPEPDARPDFVRLSNEITAALRG